MANTYRALGLMSGTSLDGIDVALIESDGHRIHQMGPVLYLPYAPELAAAIRPHLGRPGPFPELAQQITDAQSAAVHKFLKQENLSADHIDLIGFHGQTIFHDPAAGITVQLGDGQRMADHCGIPVVSNFRQADVAAGGEGAPLAPIYHAALAQDLEKPIAIANIGGVANVTWIGESSDPAQPNLLAFDTGPGNALIDDWVRHHGQGTHDVDGYLAAQGKIDMVWLKQALSVPYLNRTPPKSLDREDFSYLDVSNKSLPDGAACLTAFTARTIAAAAKHFPEPARAWSICGGGRHNGTLMSMLQDTLPAPVTPVEDLGWRGDSLEAEAFAFLAIRSHLSLPLSFPKTTGVPVALTGGKLFRP